MTSSGPLGDSLPPHPPPRASGTDTHHLMSPSQEGGLEVNLRDRSVLAVGPGHQTGRQAATVCGFLTSPPMAVSGKTRAFWLFGERQDPSLPHQPHPGSVGRPPSTCQLSSQACLGKRHSTLRPGWAGSTLHVPWPPYTICRAAEQNFLINKQDLGFHVGEALTEEGPGLSPLSAPGPANSSLPGRAKRREEGEPGQEHIFRLSSHRLAAGRSSSHFPRRPSHQPRGLWAQQPPGPLPSQA